MHLLRSLTFFILSFLIASSTWALSPSTGNGPLVRVRIGKSLRQIMVSGFDLSRHIISTDDVKSFEGKKAVRFNCETFKSMNKDRNQPIHVASLESKTGLIAFENDKYRGLLKVITSPKGDSCDVVNVTPMEDYIAQLLPKEMNGTWPIEALKAQAVAARSYALHKMTSQQVSKILGNEAFYDLESSEKHQVGGSFFDATEKTSTASLDTKGEVLIDQEGRVAPVYFHAKCGGRTLRPDQVWNNREAGYQGVNCPFCIGVGPKPWDKVVTEDRIKEFLYWAIKNKYLKFNRDSVEGSVVKVLPDNYEKYKVSFYINDRLVLIEKSLLRRFFGRFILPSNSFYLKKESGLWSFVGEGLGHGVGLCQIGALAMAQRGWDYRKILSHYFPGHSLKKMY